MVASPYSPTRRWSEADDEYLRNVVTAVTDAVGPARIKAFWLAGHSLMLSAGGGRLRQAR